MLRKALDDHFLKDAGLGDARAPDGSLSKVIVPLYPRAVDASPAQSSGGTPTLCEHGNEGMEIGVLDETFVGDDAEHHCEASQIFFGGVLPTHGVILAVRKSGSLDPIRSIEDFRSGLLNGSGRQPSGLTEFASGSGSRPAYTLISALDRTNGPFGGRGFCATTEPQNRASGAECLSLNDLISNPPPPDCSGSEAGDDREMCVAKSAESLRVARYFPSTGPWRPFAAESDPSHPATTTSANSYFGPLCAQNAAIPNAK
jgi:hypothetical protein